MEHRPTDLRHYLRVVRRHRRVVVACLLGGLAASMGLAARGERYYVARAKVFIGPRTISQGDVSTAFQELTFSKEFVASYVEQLKGRTLAETVDRRLGLPGSPVQLTKRTTADVVLNTRIIAVSVRDSQAVRARDTVNAMVETFVDDLERGSGTGGVKASVFETALLPEPVEPSYPRFGLIGAFLGLAIGLGLAFLLEQLDTRLRGRDDVESALGLPVLAVIPHSPTETRTVYVERDPSSPAAEAFRALRTSIQFMSVDNPLRTILVTSAVPEEGKTIVSLNLAASLALAGHRALYMEADLRRPVAHELLDVPRSPGLSDVLVDGSRQSQALRRTRFNNLFVLTAGSVPPNPAELLGSSRMASLLGAIPDSLSVVIIDSPPTIPVTDPAVLSRQVDGVILVVRLGKTDRERAKDAIRILERTGARILGVVINDASARRAGGSYDYYGSAYGYSYGPTNEQKAANGDGGKAKGARRKKART